MLGIDIIGLIFTAVLIGARYIHYVFIAVLLGEIGRIMMSLHVNAQLDSIITGGIFDSVSFHGVTGLSVFLIYFGGVLSNYFLGMACGGIEKEKLACFLNPFAILRKPFAVINIRLALLAGIYNGWQYLSR